MADGLFGSRSVGPTSKGRKDAAAAAPALPNMLNGCTRTSSDAPAPSTPHAHVASDGPAAAVRVQKTTGVYTAANGGCVASYEDGTGDVDCGQLPTATKPVRVNSIGNDPYGLDGDRDGRACER